MTKEQHIQYWMTSANDDLLTVDSLLKEKRFVHSIYFGHLVLEKICKAIWVKNNLLNNPPRTHNLIKLIEEANVVIIEEDGIFLRQLNDFQIEGRYPDYLFEINKICNFEFTVETINKIKKICKKLQEIMQ